MYSEINKTTAEYDDNLDKFALVRACLRGKKEVVSLGEGIMPSPDYKVVNYVGENTYGEKVTYSNESEIAQRKIAYWARARWLPATKKTQQALDGLIHSHAHDIEVDEKLEFLRVDDAVKKITSNVTAFGEYGVLVTTDGSLGTNAGERDRNLTNIKWVHYAPEDIIYKRFKGEKLVEVRLMERVEEKDGEYNYKHVKAIRRLVIGEDGKYYNQLAKEYGDTEEDKAQWSEPVLIGGSASDEITFFLFGADHNGGVCDYIPLFDIAQLNAGHLRLDADNRDNLHYHGQGMTNIYTDMDPEQMMERNPAGMDCGASGRNVFMQGDRVEILQIDATGAIPAEIERDERRIVMAGAQLATTGADSKTLGGKQMDAASTMAPQKRVAVNCSDGIEQLLRWTYKFAGITGEPKYRLNTNFVSDSMTFQDVAAAFQAVLAGKLPDEILFDVARKAGYTKLEDDEIMEKVRDGALTGGMTEEQARLLAQQEANNGDS